MSLLTVMAGAAVAPALNAISAHFADANPLLIQLVVSMPALFIILTNLCFPMLCRVMRTRTIALCGLLLYVVAGSGAFFADNIVVLLVLRALLGVSVGMIMPLSTGLLAYYFPPEEQARLMGLAAAMNQMGGVVATFLAGMLAAVSWNYAFLVYLLGLIAQYPWLKAEMAKVNEKFKMLNTPVGKIMLGKATIAEMSKKSEMEVEAIIEKIKGLINQHINQ